MLWKVTSESQESITKDLPFHDGRFVLHQHRDNRGEHVDLRVEWGDTLLGWRIEGNPFAEQGAWAEEKMPHPRHWLTQDGNALREDSGLYRWLDRNDAQRRILLKGRKIDSILTFVRVDDITPSTIGVIRDVLLQHRLDPRDAASLIRDGMAARKRATARLCGLGKELDGNTFDEGVWRKALSHLSLDEIHQQLRAFELRYDLAYPPEPVSKPEKLIESSDADAFRRGLKFLQDTAS